MREKPRRCTASTLTGVPLTAFGQTKSASAWARDRRAAVNAQTIRLRVRDGVDPEEAITAPWLRHPKRGKARRYGRIDWNRVRQLRNLPVAAIARKLRRSETAIRRGMKKQGWLRPVVRSRELTHGKALLGVWSNLRNRGHRPSWPDFLAFHAWALRSSYAPGLFITRLDRDVPHGPKNSRWLPVAESWQYRRPKTVTRNAFRRIRAFGELKGAAEWARDPRCVVTLAGLLARLDRGMKPKDAITKRKRREADYSSSKQVRAWGVEKPIAAWARDRRAEVGPGSIGRRLRAGWRPEAAISTAIYARPR